MNWSRRLVISAFALSTGSMLAPAEAQIAPSQAEISAYDGLHRAAQDADAGAIGRLAMQGADLNGRDSHGRTPVMIAAHARHAQAIVALADHGADLDLLDHDCYDALTIAAVADFPDIVRLLVARGANARLVTSIYDGTALIAAAHLGHAEVVRELIAGGAPLDHVNNLGWTALIEAIVLGDGGPRHIDTVRALVTAGANVDLADRNGRTPLTLAEARGLEAIAVLLRVAGAQ